MPRWFRRPPPAFVPVAGPVMAATAVMAVVMAMALVVAGCGSDTTTIELTAVGRNTDVEQPLIRPAVETDGLQSCADVPLLVPEPRATPSGTGDLDQRVLAVLAAYTSANEATFAGLWLDARFGGAPMVAFSDDLEPHRSAILTALGGDGGVMPFGLVAAHYSDADLQAAVEHLSTALASPGSTVLQAAAVDATRNRLSLELVDPTEEDLDLVLGLAPPNMVCGEIVTTGPIPDGPLDLLPRDGEEKLLSCGELPFPESALAERVPIGAIDHPAAALVVPFTGDSASTSELGEAGAGDWIVLAVGPDRALFGKYDGELEATVTAVRSGSAWEISGWAFGCELRIGLPHGLGAVEVFLDPASPPGSDRRTVDVLVSELACAGGDAMGDRLLGPQVLEVDGRVLVAFAAVVRPGSGSACPGNPMTPIRVELDEPLGTRAVMNGMFLPPRPLATQ